MISLRNAVTAKSVRDCELERVGFEEINYQGAPNGGIPQNRCSAWVFAGWQ